MDTTSFYASLKAFSQFAKFTSDEHYKDAPDDWVLVITDIRGSTKAISEGRYKEVNTIGAASIVMARKAMMNADFPFVFGGDGATFLIPNKYLPAVVDNLSSLRELSLANHGLELRIGGVSVAKIRESGKKLSIAKFEITDGRNIALFKGDGLSWAESQIKGSEEYLLHKKSGREPDLSGLSCRWNPIPSKRGKILTLLVSSRGKSDVYDNFLSKLHELIPSGLDSINPTNVEVATYKPFMQLLREERKLHSFISPKFIGRVLEIGVAVLIFKFGINPLIFNPKKYAASMRTHSDFRKFDDLLRMVIDVSHAEIQNIQSYLESEFAKGSLFFGVHQADASLMTCYVDGLGQGQHIHFIDAEDGGYAMAAVGLKAQMKSSHS